MTLGYVQHVKRERSNILVGVGNHIRGGVALDARERAIWDLRVDAHRDIRSTACW